jgi:hypothetical protein
LERVAHDQIEQGHLQMKMRTLYVWLSFVS